MRGLTDREYALLRELVYDETFKVVALRLGYTEARARRMAGRAYRKLGVDNRGAAMKRAGLLVIPRTVL